jgi:hypothetical protein
MVFDIGFFNTHLYDRAYLRNNKTNGKKNVRCFPYCNVNIKKGEFHHSEGGFCGAPIQIVLGWKM